MCKDPNFLERERGVVLSGWKRNLLVIKDLGGFFFYF